jgi:hypothetical protein
MTCQPDKITIPGMQMIMIRDPADTTQRNQPQASASPPPTCQLQMTRQPDASFVSAPLKG